MGEASNQRYTVIGVGAVRVIELRLPDELEAIEFDALNAELAALILQEGAIGWVIDLALTSYLGSALLGMLVNVRSKVRQSRGRLALCGVNSEIERVLRLGSMDRLFKIVETRDDAVAAIS